MSSETLFESNGESSNPYRQPNERKNKRYVKKKGEARKRNSIDNASTSVGRVPESFDIDKVSEKFESMRIKREKEIDMELRTRLDDKNLMNYAKTSFSLPERKFEGDENSSGVNKTDLKIDKNKSAMNSEVKNEEKLISDEEKEEKAEEEEFDGKAKNGEKSVIANESAIRLMSEEKEEKERDGFKKNFDKGKTAEQRKRDRQTARFAKAVARFSIKFMKAARELGIVRLDEGSNSCSDSSSTRSDSSCATSCTCSECCTTDSSTCSCSDCISEECSTCSSSSSKKSTSTNSTSTSTPNSSTSSSESSSSTSSSISAETFSLKMSASRDVKKKIE